MNYCIFQSKVDLPITQSVKIIPISFESILTSDVKVWRFWTKGPCYIALRKAHSDGAATAASQGHKNPAATKGEIQTTQVIHTLRLLYECIRER